MKNLPSFYSPMERMLDDFFNDGVFFTPTRPRRNLMKTDVYEKDGHYSLSIELPGFTKEEINVDVIDGSLVIKAEHKEENEKKDEKGNLISSERHYGSCSRSFFIGRNVKATDIKAKFENGVLDISLPSQETKALETKETVSID